MKKVYILELSKSPHLSSVINIYKLLEKSEDYIPIIFKYNFLQKDLLNQDEYRIYTRSFIKLLYDLEKQDIVIVNTISLRTILPTLIIALRTDKLGIYVRNANSWKNYYFNSKRVIYSLKNFINTFGRKLIKPRTSFYLCGNYNMLRLLNRWKFQNSMVIPFSGFYQSVHFSPSKNNRLEYYVIPGAIDFKRKNIDLILEAYKNSNKRFLIALLGTPRNVIDKEKLERWKAILGDYLITFESFISYKDYNNYISNSKAIIASIYPKIIDEGFHEKYGFSKDSGVESHSIISGKKLIINSTFSVDEFLSPFVINYKNQKELTNIMNDFQTQVNNTNDFLSEYSFDYIQKKFLNILKIS